MKTRREKKAFTLLELLFVLGLVAALVAFFIPALGFFHERALSVQCKSNWRQLATTCLNYTMNEGFFPWGMVDPGTHDAAYFKTPDFLLIYPREDPARHGVTRWGDYASFCWDFTRKAGQTGWNCGEMFGGIEAASVFSCPKCRAKSDNWDGNHVTGYNYNVCYLGYVENDASKRCYPTAWREIKNPSAVVVFGDGGYAGGPNKFMRAPIQDKEYDKSSASLRKAGTQAFRHGWGKWRHCNMAFLDGHVEEFSQPFKSGGAKGWVDKQTYSAFISSGNGIYGPRGFGITDDDETM